MFGLLEPGKNVPVFCKWYISILSSGPKKKYQYHLTEIFHRNFHTNGKRTRYYRHPPGFFFSAAIRLWEKNSHKNRALLMNTFPIPMGVCLQERTLYKQWPTRMIDRLGQPCNLCIFSLLLICSGGDGRN